MKILVISSAFVPAWGWGGPVRSIWNLARGMERLGVKVTVLTTNAMQNGVVDVPRLREEEGVKIVTASVFGRKRFWLINGIGIAPRMILDIIKCTGQNDIIHLNDIFGWHSIEASIVAHKNGRPLIISPHGCLDVWPLYQKRKKKELFLRIFGNNIFNKADGIHFTTENENRQAPFCLVGDKGFVVPNAVEFGAKGDAERFRVKFDVEPCILLVGIVGRIHKIKGFDKLIPALSRSKREDINLIIVGPDEAGYKKSVEKMVRENGLGKRVRFLGMLTGDDLADVYAGMDLLVAPSYHESFGNVVAEAAAQGTPCIISDQVGLKDWVSVNDIGLVLPLDSNIWAEALSNIQKKDILKRWEPVRLSRIVRESFSMENVAKQMLEHYEDILRCKRR